MGSSQAGAGTVVAVQRRVSDTGVVMVTRQTVALGRTHAGKTVTVDVTDTDLVVACDDGPQDGAADQPAQRAPVVDAHP